MDCRFIVLAALVSMALATIYDGSAVFSSIKNPEPCIQFQAPLPTAVIVGDCMESPCSFKNTMVFFTVLEFTAPETLYSPILGLFLEDPTNLTSIEDRENVICGRVKCPIYAGTPVQAAVKVDLEPFEIQKSIFVELYIMENWLTVTCARFVVILTA